MKNTSSLSSSKVSSWMGKCIKVISERHAYVVMFSLVAISAFATAERVKNGKGGEKQSELNQLEKELQLSFLEYQKTLPDGLRDPETRRRALGQWHESQANKRGQISNLRKEIVSDKLEEIRVQRMLPEYAPFYDERNLEKFIEDADAYLRAVIAYHAPTGVDVTLEDRVKARENVGAFLAQRENRELMKNLREAKTSLTKGKGQMRPPLNKAAMARLSGFEKFDEEAYAVKFRLVAEGKETPQDFREAMAPLSDQLKKLIEEERLGEESSKKERLEEKILELKKNSRNNSDER
ncbi:MAG: hypothetical protein ABF380_12925 [Akkermansiaceae bacterium]